MSQTPTSPTKSVQIIDIGEEDDYQDRDAPLSRSESASAHDGAPGSRIPVSADRKPMKSILKRSASMRTDRKFADLTEHEKRDHVTPLKAGTAEPGATGSMSRKRTSPLRDSTPSDSRIPTKLQVHFPEAASDTVIPTTSQPVQIPDSLPVIPPGTEYSISPSQHRMHDSSPMRGSECDFDESSSVGSNVSNLVGTWWFGKNNKFVPHCEKRHSHDGGNIEYLTPTQRKNRETSDLKKQLVLAEKSLADKEKHLGQLRERLTELETVLESNSSLMENHRLQLHMKDLETQLEHARTDTRRVSIHFEQEAKNAELIRQQNRVEVSTSTSHIVTVETGVDNCADELPPDAKHLEELENLRAENAQLQQQITEFESGRRRRSSTGTVMSMSLNGVLPDLNTLEFQMQAYYNESVAWRTRYSEIELAYKNLQQEALSGAPMTPQRKLSLMNTPEQRLSTMNAFASSQQNTAVDATSTKPAATTPMSPFLAKQNGFDTGTAPMTDSGFGEVECIRESCLAKKRSLTEENEELHNQVEELELKLHEAQMSSDDLEAKIATVETERESARTEATSWEHEVNMNQAKVDCAALSVARLQEENVEYYTKLEEQRDEIDQLKNHMIDAGIFVGRKTLTIDRSYSTSHSIHSQTELTSHCLDSNDDEFMSLTDRISKLEAKYKSEQSGWSETIEQVQESLNVKSELVKTLTRQLDQLNDTYESARESMTNERNEFYRKLEEIGNVAARVPSLEIELEGVHEQLRKAELVLQDQYDNYNDAIETSMNDSLRTQADTVDIWKARLMKCNKTLVQTQSALKTTEQKLSDTIMRMNLEKLQLEEKLSSCYSEIEELHGRVYKPMKHQEVQATASTSETGCTASAEMVDAETVLLRGDLFDEVEERLKLTSGELSTTRRQVEILQDKFQEKLQEVTSTKETVEKISETKKSLESEIQQAREEFHSVQMKYEQTIGNLENVIKNLEGEKVAMHQDEKDRIRQIEYEFDNVRQEMNDVIQKYEAEKRRQKDRIKQLESGNDALRAEMKALIETNALGSILNSNTNVDLMELDLLEQRIEGLLPSGGALAGGSNPQLNEQSTELTAGTESKSANNSPRFRRRNTPAIKFLLDRLQTERLKYADENEALEKQVRDLNSELEMVRNSASSNRPRRMLRACSVPYIVSESNGKTSFDSEGLAQSRAKNLLLMKENQRLMTELVVVRDNVVYVLEKQENLQTKAEISEAAVESGMVAHQSRQSQFNQNIDADSEETIDLIADPPQDTAEPLSFVQTILLERKLKKGKRKAAKLAQSIEAREQVQQRGGEGGSPIPPEPSASTSSKTRRHKSPHKSPLRQGSHTLTTTQSPPPPALRSPAPDGLASDLNEVRINLQGILTQIDNATSSNISRAAPNQRESRLMNWLESELEEEKKELEALSNWYDMDKNRLNTELTSVKHERNRLNVQLDDLALDFHDCSRELELYKQEDAARINESKASNLARFRSFTDLQSVRLQQSNWRIKYGKLYREFIGIQRDFELVDKQRREYKQEVDIISGEIEILRAEREVENERLEQEGGAPARRDTDTEALSKNLRDIYDNRMAVLRREAETSLENEKKQRHVAANLEIRCRQLDKELSSARNELRSGTLRLNATQAQMKDLQAKYDLIGTAASVPSAVDEAEPQKASEFFARQEQKRNVAKSEDQQMNEHIQSLNILTSDSANITSEHKQDKKNVSDSQQAGAKLTIVKSEKKLEKSIEDETRSGSVNFSDVLQDIDHILNSPDDQTADSQSLGSIDGLGELKDDFVQLINKKNSFDKESLTSANTKVSVIVDVSVDPEVVSAKDERPRTSDTMTAQQTIRTSDGNDPLVKSALVAAQATASIETVQPCPTFETCQSASISSAPVIIESSIAFGGAGTLPVELQPIPTICITPDDHPTSDTMSTASLEYPTFLSDEDQPEHELEALARSIESEFENKSEEELERIVNEMENEIAEMKRSHVTSPVDQPLSPTSPPLNRIQMNHSMSGPTISLSDLELRVMDAVLERERELTEAHNDTLLNQMDKNKQKLVTRERELWTEFEKKKEIIVKEKDAVIKSLTDQINVLTSKIEVMESSANDDRRATSSSVASTYETVPTKLSELDRQTSNPRAGSQHRQRSVSFNNQPSDVYSSLDWTTEASYGTAPSTRSLSRRRCDSEPQIALLAATEERAWMAEKELAMLTKELFISKHSYEQETKELKAERDDLAKKLHHAVLIAERVRLPIELQDALDTNCQLQSEIADLHSQLEQKEVEHQQMYLLMFKQGQETAKAELLAEYSNKNTNTRSRSESITSFEQPEKWYIKKCDTFNQTEGVPVEFESEAASRINSLGVVGNEDTQSGLSDEQAVLRFLRDATYYFLLNKDTKDHLHAIMCLLKFTEKQRHEVGRIRKDVQ